jgi:predicted DsbA family dithiol-disulfide isomerase
VRQAGIWLARVKELRGDDLELNWRSFALEQVNARDEPGWKAWEQGPEYVSRGLVPLRGGVAARNQGEEAHFSYMFALLEAKHVEREDIRTREAVIEIAQSAGLDVPRFEDDIDDPATLEQVVRDHESAAEQGVFGTPTIVFEDGFAVFLKMYTPPENETMSAFEHFIGLARGRKYFGEMKRPQPPWPRGVFDD